MASKSSPARPKATTARPTRDQGITMSAHEESCVSTRIRSALRSGTLALVALVYTLGSISPLAAAQIVVVDAGPFGTAIHGSMRSVRPRALIPITKAFTALFVLLTELLRASTPQDRRIRRGLASIARARSAATG